MPLEDYNFGAMCAVSNEWHPLTIQPLDLAAKNHLNKVWHKKYQAVRGHFDLAEAPGVRPGWIDWKPYEWSQQNVADRITFAAWDGDTLAGFLNLRIPFRSHFCDNLDAMHIEHACTSPGNRETPIWSRRLSDVGSTLVAFAVFESLQRGMDGRVALHATTESVGLYTQLALDSGVDLFHQHIPGVPGIFDGHVDQEYFETKAENATAFLEAFRHE